MNFKDFLTGITSFFVIFLPGSIFVFSFVLVFDFYSVQSIDLENTTGLLLLIISYIIGHVISLIASYIEDKTKYKKNETNPVLRAMARIIVSNKVSAGVAFQGNIRRWAASILREENSNAYGEILRKDADRRFFRNIRVVLALLIATFLITVLLLNIPEALIKKPENCKFTVDKISTITFLIVSVISLPLVNFRYNNQNKKYTQLVFESLVCKFSCDIPKEFISTEVRWFGENKVSEKVANKFSNISVIKRTDYYWIKPIKKRKTSKFDFELFTNTGVKYRESRLELKSKHKNLPSTNEFLISNANIEKWGKMNLGLFPEFADSKNNSGWIPIIKKMKAIKFKYENQKLDKVALNSLINGVGCKVELTNLETRKETFWTVAFEAFGNENEQLEVLEAAVKEILGDFDKADLNNFIKIESMGYPEWISNLVEKQENNKFWSKPFTSIMKMTNKWLSKTTSNQ